jgi:glutaredoxin 3
VAALLSDCTARAPDRINRVSRLVVAVDRKPIVRRANRSGRTDMPDEKTATLYRNRMVLPDHTCPFGLRAKAMLEENGFTVEDRILSTRDAVDAFEAEQKVRMTPQIFIAGERIGGSDDLERYLWS